MSGGVIKKRRARRANGTETRRRLLKAGLKLFAVGGYKATSLRRIASEGSVDLATLKYHFGDKPSLFGEVYRKGHEQFLMSIYPLFANLSQVERRENLSGSITELVNGFHDFIAEQGEFVRLLLFHIPLQCATATLVAVIKRYFAKQTPFPCCNEFVGSMRIGRFITRTGFLYRYGRAGA